MFQAIITFFRRRREAKIRRLLTQLYSLNGKRYTFVPVEPSHVLLNSMALRYDHGIGFPEIGEDAARHARRIASTLVTMRQLHEEVVNQYQWSKK